MCTSNSSIESKFSGAATRASHPSSSWLSIQSDLLDEHLLLVEDNIFQSIYFYSRDCFYTTIGTVTRQVALVNN